jgi:hypothetical protein
MISHARFLVLTALVLTGCGTAKKAAITSFRVLDAPARFVRDRIDPAETTTTTTTTESSDVVIPGRPVAAPTPPPPRITRTTPSLPAVQGLRLAILRVGLHRMSPPRSLGRAHPERRARRLRHRQSFPRRGQYQDARVTSTASIPAAASWMSPATSPETRQRIPTQSRSLSSHEDAPPGPATFHARHR